MIKKFLNFIKFEHSIFALPFAYAGAVLAENSIPGIITLIWITLAAVGARSAAMSLNRLIDAKIDAKNPRTKNRHIPRGDIEVRSAVIFTILSFILVFISAYNLNMLCLKLSPILVVVFVIYPYLKRYTYFSHLFLGLCLGIAPVGGWLAVTGIFDLNELITPILLLFAVMFWVAGFDIIYALHDFEFDRKHNLYSIPAKFGIARALKISFIFHLLTIAFLYSIIFSHNLNLIYILGVTIIAILLIYEHLIVSKKDMSRIQEAFFKVNGAVSVILLISVVFDVLFPLKIF